MFKGSNDKTGLPFTHLFKYLQVIAPFQRNMQYVNMDSSAKLYLSDGKISKYNIEQAFSTNLQKHFFQQFILARRSPHTANI